MSVARGTTPIYRLNFTEEGLDFTEANNVYVTFRKGAKIITKTGDDIEVAPKRIDIYLNQKETLSFASGEVKVQVNWTLGGGRRAASVVKTIDLSEQLLEKVIE